MKRRIVDYNQDNEGHWRVVLDCGHVQHVRHDPPIRTREWVLTDKGRASRLGSYLECRKCEEGVSADFEV